MLRLEKSEAADLDMLDVWEYTYMVWGEDQADRYLDKLDTGFRRLLENPKIGKSRNEYHPGIRSLIIEHHIAFYSGTPNTIRIERVLHESMDVKKHIDID